MNDSAQKNQLLKTEEFPQTSSVFVAGCASMIGSHLCEELLNLGCFVYGIDNLSTGEETNLNKIINNKNFIFLREDLNSPVWRFDKPIDYIFHLAGAGEYLGERDISLNTLLVNAAGTTKLLELVKKNNAKIELVSTVNVLSGSLSNKSLGLNFGFTKRETKQYFYHEAKRYAEALVTEYYKKYHIDARIVRVVDVYGPRMNLDDGRVISGLIKQATTDGVLTIAGDGLLPLYPTYVLDIVSGMVKALFGHDTSGHIYNLVSKEKTTILSFAHSIKKHQGNNARVVFVPDSKDKYFVLPPDWIVYPQHLGWLIKTGLDEGIKHTLAYFGSHKPNEKITNVFDKHINLNTQTIVSKTKENIYFSPLKKKTIKAVTVGLILLFVLCIPALIIFLSAINIRQNLFAARNEFKTKNYSKITVLTKNIASRLSLVQYVSRFYQPIYGLFGKREDYNNSIRFLNLSVSMAESLTHLAFGVKYFDEATKIILLPEKEGSLGISLGMARQEMSFADDKLAYIQSQIPLIDFNKLPVFKINQSAIQEYIGQFKKYRTYLSKTRDFSAVLPSVIAVNGKKTYLLLFANNMEIRPSGGFIGSYGFLTFENGKMGELKIEDIYSADGQLTGHVEPPGPIRKYLSQPHWYLRDSNWSPDFIQAARQAEWFLEKEIGRKADGVILLDLNVIKKLLEILGPINLPDYKETINANNFFEKTNYYSQNEFFPGSTQKKDFLATLARGISAKLLTGWKDKGVEILFLINSQLEEKHLVVSFHDEPTQNIISRFNWAGRIAGDVCGALDNCLADYLMVVEANLGVNKANLYVTKKISQKILIDENLRLKEKITIKFNNESVQENKVSGVYKNYLRILLPAGATLVNILEDEQEKPFVLSSQESGSEQGKLVVTKEEIMGKTAYGFFIEVPLMSKKTISLSYDLDSPLAIGKDAVYKMVLQKQIGSRNDDYELEIFFPNSVKPLEVTPKVIIAPNRITLSKTIDQDEIIGVRLVK